MREARDGNFSLYLGILRCLSARARSNRDRKSGWGSHFHKEYARRGESAQRKCVSVNTWILNLGRSCHCIRDTQFRDNFFEVEKNKRVVMLLLCVQVIKIRMARKIKKQGISEVVKTRRFFFFSFIENTAGTKIVDIKLKRTSFPAFPFLSLTYFPLSPFLSSNFPPSLPFPSLLYVSSPSSFLSFSYDTIIFRNTYEQLKLMNY